jgi:TrmH family RNA methyltransferase
MSIPLRPLKWYRGLSSKERRLEAGTFLVEGNKAVRQLIDSQPEKIIEIVSTEEPDIIYHRYPRRVITESQFKYICHTRTPQGIMAVVSIPVDTYSDVLPDNVGDKILLLEDIQDPGNVGTLIRTAAAFDFSGVILTEGCADPFSPKCVQAAVGTVLSLWLRRTSGYLELSEDLRDSGYNLFAAELTGNIGPSILRDRQKLLLALGNEAAGLSKALLDISDYRIRISTVRTKAESLNAAVCGAILMYLSSRDNI